jgi:hypothetical protein
MAERHPLPIRVAFYKSNVFRDQRMLAHANFGAGVRFSAIHRSSFRGTKRAARLDRGSVGLAKTSRALAAATPALPLSIFINLQS